MDEAGDVFATFADAARPAHGISPDASVRLLNVSENGTFVVDDPQAPPGEQRSVLRVHRRGYHSRAAIESELAWITALREAHIVDTPAILTAQGGERVVEAVRADGDSRYVVRFAWVDGDEPHAGRLVADFERLGAIAARLHGFTKVWTRPPGFTRHTWDVQTAIGPSGHWGHWRHGQGVRAAERAVLQPVADTIGRRLAAFGQGPERFGLVHADMRLANLLVDDHGADAETVTVIDFDDCGFSWFVYDLAASLSFIEHEPVVPELIDAWLRGYRSVAPLSAHDEAQVWTLIMLRRLLLVAWIGSHAGVDTAKQLGSAYTVGTCDLAERYLSTH